MCRSLLAGADGVRGRRRRACPRFRGEARRFAGAGEHSPPWMADHSRRLTSVVGGAPSVRAACVGVILRRRDPAGWRYVGRRRLVAGWRRRSACPV